MPGASGQVQGVAALGTNRSPARWLGKGSVGLPESGETSAPGEASEPLAGRQWDMAVSGSLRLTLTRGAGCLPEAPGRTLGCVIGKLGCVCQSRAAGAASGQPHHRGEGGLSPWLWWQVSGWGQVPHCAALRARHVGQVSRMEPTGRRWLLAGGRVAPVTGDRSELRFLLISSSSCCFYLLCVQDKKEDKRCGDEPRSQGHWPRRPGTWGPSTLASDTCEDGVAWWAAPAQRPSNTCSGQLLEVMEVWVQPSGQGEWLSFGGIWCQEPGPHCCPWAAHLASTGPGTCTPPGAGLPGLQSCSSCQHLHPAPGWPTWSTACACLCAGVHGPAHCADTDVEDRLCGQG